MKDVEIDIPYEIDWVEEEIQDRSKIKFQSVAKAEGQKLKYLYDFADYWLYHISVEKIVNIKANNAELIAGKGRCPTVDCGGFSGFVQLKEIMANPNDPEYAENESMAWYGKG